MKHCSHSWAVCHPLVQSHKQAWLMYGLKHRRLTPEFWGLGMSFPRPSLPESTNILGKVDTVTYTLSKEPHCLQSLFICNCNAEAIRSWLCFGISMGTVLMITPSMKSNGIWMAGHGNQSGPNFWEMGCLPQAPEKVACKFKKKTTKTCNWKQSRLLCSLLCAVLAKIAI